MTLETHLSWREPYASVSLNRKHSGIIPPGVYRGFVVSAGGGMALNIAPNVGDYPRSVAVVDRDGFNFTVSSDDTETFTVPDGTSGTLYLCLQSQYIEGGGGTSTFVLIASGSIQAYHVVLAQLVIPGGTTTITAGMINSTGRTLPMGTQFDAGALLASRSFVQRALGNKSGSTSLNSQSTLTAAHAGKIVQISGSGPYTITLPLVSEVADGVEIEFVCTASGTITIQRQGANQIYPAMANAVNSFTMVAGDTAILKVANSVWGLIGGSVLLSTHPQFKAVLGDSGYQKLPGGFIMQWGITPTSSALAAVSTSFALAFPNACKAITFGASGSNNGFMISIESYSTSGFTSSVYSNNTTRVASVQAQYHAIGY